MPARRRCLQRIGQLAERHHAFHRAAQDYLLQRGVQAIPRRIEPLDDKQTASSEQPPDQTRIRGFAKQNGEFVRREPGATLQPGDQAARRKPEGRGELPRAGMPVINDNSTEQFTQPSAPCRGRIAHRMSSLDSQPNQSGRH